MSMKEWQQISHAFHHADTSIFNLSSRTVLLQLTVYYDKYILYFYLLRIENTMDAFLAKKGIKLSKPSNQTNENLLKSTQKQTNEKPIQIYNKYQVPQPATIKTQTYHTNPNSQSLQQKNEITDTRDSINMFNSNISYLSNQDKSFKQAANSHQPYKISKPFVPVQPKKKEYNLNISYSRDKMPKSTLQTGLISPSTYKQRLASQHSQQKITALPYKSDAYEIQQEKPITNGYFSQKKSFSPAQLPSSNKSQINNYRKDELLKIEPELNSHSTYNTYNHSINFQHYMKSYKNPEESPTPNIIPTPHHYLSPQATNYPRQNSQMSQKLKLMKQINEKSYKIRQLHKQIQSNTIESQSKISRLQYEIKYLQQKNKQLTQQNANNKQWALSEQQKSEKSRNQVNKLIFFEQDLKYAKDYDKLSEQLSKLQRQNNKMYNEHYAYIIEMSQMRKKYQKELAQLQEQYNKIKIEFRYNCQKIEKIIQIQSGDDKMLLIKLQNDINYLKKKNQELMQVILKKQQDAQQLHNQIKHIKQSQKKETVNPQDQFNFNQIKQTLDQYELRILRFQNVINEKDNTIEDHKTIIEQLTTEIRQGKKDHQISNMKEKSYENNLKNQIQMLKISLQNQSQIYRKKITNLQDALQRKVKEIIEKDKFIKSFLLGRIKELQGSFIDKIIEKIEMYLNFEYRQQLKKEMKLRQEKELQALKQAELLRAEQQKEAIELKLQQQQRIRKAQHFSEQQQAEQKDEVSQTLQRGTTEPAQVQLAQSSDQTIESAEMQSIKLSV